MKKQPQGKILAVVFVLFLFGSVQQQRIFLFRLWQIERLFQTADKVGGDANLANVRSGGNFEHHIRHGLLQNGAESACTGVTLQRHSGDRAQRLVLKGQRDAVHIKQLHILLDQGVLGLADDANECFVVKIVQRDDDGQTTDQLGNQAEFHNVVRSNVAENALFAALFLFHDGTLKADGLISASALNQLFQAVEGAAADKENIFGIDAQKFLVGMLSSALGRNVGNGTLQNFQERLLYTLAGNVAGDGAVFASS